MVLKKALADINRKNSAAIVGQENPDYVGQKIIKT